MLEKIKRFFQPGTSHVLNEDSPWSEIVAAYPNANAFLTRQYGLTLDGKLSTRLSDLSYQHSLPPAQVLFMEIQLDQLSLNIQTIPPKQLVKELDHFRLLDVREAWETKLASLPGAQYLDKEKLEKVLHWPKDTPIAVFCHFGIRSLDVASYLLGEGFSDVRVLKGGIDAWSQEVDPSVDRYEGAWC